MQQSNHTGIIPRLLQNLPWNMVHALSGGALSGALTLQHRMGSNMNIMPVLKLKCFGCFMEAGFLHFFFLRALSLI